MRAQWPDWCVQIQRTGTVNGARKVIDDEFIIDDLTASFDEAKETARRFNAASTGPDEDFNDVQSRWRLIYQEVIAEN